MSENRLQRLHDAGQSIWLDFIDRTMLRNGDLAASHSRRRAHRHDVEPDDLREGARRRHRRTTIRFASARRRPHGDGAVRAHRDDRRARRVRHLPPGATTQTNGADGFVSIEVSPGAANDATATIAEAHAPLGDGRSAERDDQGSRHRRGREGRSAARSPNGVNVNITLLFAIDAYERVIDAYMAGLEDRVAAGKDISTHSLGRELLRQPRRHRDRQAARRGDQGRRAEREALEALHGKAAIANAKLAYKLFQERDRVAALEGARGEGRDGAASAVGEHEHEESGVPRRDVRRGAHRPGHGEHDAAGDDRRVPRSRRSSSARSTRTSTRRSATIDALEKARRLDERRHRQAARRRPRQLPEVVRHADRRTADEDEGAGQGAGREPTERHDRQHELTLRYCRTKIVCTLGPSSSSRDALRSLIDAGLNVARINFSHGTHEQHAATIALVREVADELGRPVAILGDLQGPRIRIGDLPAPRELADGSDVVLVPEATAQPATRFPSPTRRSPTTSTSATAS